MLTTISLWVLQVKIVIRGLHLDLNVLDLSGLKFGLKCSSSDLSKLLFWDLIKALYFMCFACKFMK